MSGPKCSQYELDQRIARQAAEAEEARRREAERQRLEELRLIREWTEKIQQQIHDLENTNQVLVAAQNQFPTELFPKPLILPAMPKNLSSTTLQAHFNLLASLTVKAQEQISEVNRRIANAGMRQLISKSSGHISGEIKSLEDWLREIRTEKTGVRLASIEERQATVMRLMKGLDSADQSNEIKRVRELFLTENHAPRLELIEKELRIVLQRARQQAAIKRQLQTDAQSLLLQLPTFDVPDLDAVREDLQRAACGLMPLNIDLQERVTKLKKIAETMLAERSAGDIAASALQDLGYEVNDNFSTLFVTGGEVFVQRPGSREYYVALDVDKDKNQVTLRAVRDGDNSASLSRELMRRDAEAEKEFCNDFPKIINALTTYGIRTQLLSAGRAGTQEVEVLDLSAEGRTKRRERPRTKPQTRTRKT